MMLALIQARMGSERFPGKSMSTIQDRPMLWHVVSRVRSARLVDQVAVATTEQPADNEIADFCRRERIQCYRGSQSDVLDRYYQAAKCFGADACVRVTGDCPLIDPDVIDRVVSRFLKGDCDYVSNVLRYTYPDGLDAEVFTFSVLERAWREASRPAEREHVTPYMRSGLFKTANVESLCPVAAGEYRWTVDYPPDLEFIRQIYSELNNGRCRLEPILKLLDDKPELKELPAKVISNEGYYRTLYQQATGGAAKKLELTQSQAWYTRSQRVIPGCSQTFSKGATQYVKGVAPIFLQRGKGCRVWDVDGNEYIDYVQGLLPNILGYANDQVNAAVAAQAGSGHSFSLPHPLEVELAERLIRLIPCGEMVRFGKNGSDATSGAIRAARAYTGRERVACCGYHGWQDWYVGSTTRNAGVPRAVRALTHPFRYNDLGSLETLLQQYPGEFAAVIMEPVNFVEPEAGFLQSVRDVAHKHGALLIFDEICSGFHFGMGGAQKLFGVTPDLACFGKAMGNGYPISCVLGRVEVMRIFEEIFFSFTFAGEVGSMAAAMKVLDVLENTDALLQMEENGRILQDGINAMAASAKLGGRIQCVGRPQWSLMKFYDAAHNESPLLKNLFQQEAVKRGILFLATHNMTTAHDRDSVHQTLETYAEVIKTIAAWLQDSDPSRFLEGPMSQPVFRVR